MSDRLEKLVVQLSADVRGYQTGMQRALGITNSNARAIENRYRKMNATISRAVTTPIAAAGAALSTREILRYADAWTQAGNLIKSAASASGVQTRSLSELRQGADDARTSLETYSTLYASLIRSASGVAKSEEEIATATNLVAKAMKAGGASVQEQQAAILQLGQALGSGVLQGDELRSIKENAPVIAKAIADAFGVGMAGLKKLGEEGKLTSDKVFQAILKAQAPIEAQFAQTNQTISDGFTKLGNAVTEYIGKAVEASGVTTAINTVLGALAGHIDDVAAAAAAAGVVLLSGYAPALLKVAGSQALVLATNPFLALAAGAAAAAIALSAFGDEIHPISGEMANLQDYAGALWEGIVSAASEAAKQTSDAFLSIINAITTAVSGVEVSWSDVGSSVKEVLNGMIGGVVALYEIVKANFTVLPNVIGAAAVGAMNLMIAAIEAAINEVVRKINGLNSAVNWAASKVGLGDKLIPDLNEVSFGRFENKFVDAAAKTGAEAADAIKDALSRDYFGDLSRNAKIHALDRRSQARDARDSETSTSTAGFGGGLTTPPPPPGSSGGGGKGRKGRTRKDELEKEIDQIRKRTAALVGQTEAQAGLNPYIEDYGYAMAKAEAQQSLLSAAQAAGVNLTAEQKRQIEELAEAYAQATAAKEQLDESQGRIADNIRDINGARKDAIRGLVDDLAEGKLNADSFADALKNIGNKLIDIAFNNLFSGPNGGLTPGIFSGLFGGGSAGAPAAGTGFLASLYHSGGVVGRDGTPRLVNPAVFSGARRYHTGGLVPGEVPAILQRGERVLTRGQQAAMGGGGVAVQILLNDQLLDARIVNVSGQVAAKVVDKRAAGAVAKAQARG